MMILKKKNRGIGLLELMLSLAIIAILLIMATRYYIVTSRSQKADEGVSLINALVAAAEQYRGNNPDFSNISNYKLVQQGSIASSYISSCTSEGSCTITTPWAGDSTVNVAETSTPKGYVDITLDKITATGCNNLVNKFYNGDPNKDPSGKTSCTGTDVVFNYRYPTSSQ